METLLPRIDRRNPTSEKWACTIAGGLSLFWGVKRGGLFGGLLSLAGVELLTYGISGHHTHELLGFNGKDRDLLNRIPFQSGIQVEHSVSINAPVDQVYEYFRDFENLPFFMEHIKSVEVQDETHSHWSARGPLGTVIEWDAEIISDEPNKLLSWRSVNSPDIKSAGSVHFEELPGGRGTALRVEMQYVPPAGALGAVIAKLLGEEPEAQIEEDFRRFKQRLEAGEISTTKGQPRGGESRERQGRSAAARNAAQNNDQRNTDPHHENNEQRNNGQHNTKQHDNGQPNYEESETARGASAD